MPGTRADRRTGDSSGATRSNATDLRTILLDLDDTLYPPSSGIWAAIGERINLYMRAKLGIPADQVPGLRDRFFREYGTTLNGLMRHYGADPFDYLDFVHQVPIEDMLAPDPSLARMLADLPQKKAVFTNAARAHAERVINRLGIADNIHQIIDIVRLGFVNKPDAEAFRKALELCGESQAEQTLVADDSLRNLQTARSLGMTTVLVGPHDADGSADFHIARISELVRAVPGLARPEAWQGVDSDGSKKGM